MRDEAKDDKKVGYVSPDEIDLLIAEELRKARPLSEIDLEALGKENKRVCSELIRKDKQNSGLSRKD